MSIIPCSCKHDTGWIWMRWSRRKLQHYLLRQLQYRFYRIARVKKTNMSGEWKLEWFTTFLLRYFCLLNSLPSHCPKCWKICLYCNWQSLPSFKLKLSSNSEDTTGIEKFFFFYDTVLYLRIGLCLGCIYRVMDARRKFGEHDGKVRVVWDVTESNSV